MAQTRSRKLCIKNTPLQIADCHQLKCLVRINCAYLQKRLTITNVQATLQIISKGCTNPVLVYGNPITQLVCVTHYHH